ncbi:MAG: hypothetical protein WAO55_04165 [Candidatus Manganitrophaceae bacterium]
MKRKAATKKKTVTKSTKKTAKKPTAKTAQRKKTAVKPKKKTVTKAKTAAKPKAKKAAAKKVTAKKTTAKKAVVKKALAKKPAAAPKRTVVPKVPPPLASVPPIREEEMIPSPAIPMTVPAPLPETIPPIGEHPVGRVTHYYSHLSVAVVQLNEGTLRVGETVHIKGHTTDLQQQIESIEIDHQSVQEASAGQIFGLKVRDHVREHDQVYKLSPTEQAP